MNLGVLSVIVGIIITVLIIVLYLLGKYINNPKKLKEDLHELAGEVAEGALVILKISLFATWFYIIFIIPYKEIQEIQEKRAEEFKRADFLKCYIDNKYLLIEKEKIHIPNRDSLDREIKHTKDMMKKLTKEIKKFLDKWGEVPFTLEEELYQCQKKLKKLEQEKMGIEKILTGEKPVRLKMNGEIKEIYLNTCIFVKGEGKR